LFRSEEHSRSESGADRADSGLPVGDPTEERSADEGLDVTDAFPAEPADRTDATPADDRAEAGGDETVRSGKRSRKRGGSLEALVLVLLAFLVALLLKQYVAEAYEIKGSSMQPTFANGERVVVLKSFYGLARGDIIIFASKDDPSKDLIKRVVGLPLDRLTIEGGHLRVNGEPTEEGYLLGGDTGFGYDQTLTLDNGSYFVLGDNRPDSHDSRYFGSVPQANIKGRVVLRWWPFAEFRSF